MNDGDEDIYSNRVVRIEEIDKRLYSFGDRMRRGYKRFVDRHLLKKDLENLSE